MHTFKYRYIPHMYNQYTDYIRRDIDYGESHYFAAWYYNFILCQKF